jgi:hypothetical protein
MGTSVHGTKEVFSLVEIISITDVEGMGNIQANHT